MKRSRSERPKGTSTIGARVPAVARLFNPAMPDEIRFPNLRTLPTGTAWSAVALVRLDEPSPCAGIVCQRRHLAAGANAFSVWLRDGAIVVESGASTVASKLVVPLRQWTFVGVASGADGMRVYRGAQGSVDVEELPGLLTGACNPETPLAIGRLGSSFSGAIASVCLFAEKLTDDTMRAVCAGRVDPRFAPKLAFAWLASATNDMDTASRHVPLISGTRVVPFNAGAQTLSTAPSPPITKRSTPIAMPPAPPRPVPADPLPIPIPEISIASGSSLFRELGLVPGSKEEK